MLHFDTSRREDRLMNDALSPEQERQLAARFTVLVARHGDLLRRYLLGLTRRGEVADDLCQQLWLRLYEAAKDGRFLPEDEDSFRGYLFTAARNLHLDECVRRHSVSRTATLDPRALESLAQPEAAANESPVEDELDRNHIARQVRTALDQLPAQQRDTLRLWMAGWSIAAMATRTHAPRDTVLSRKKYAMRRLRITLAELAPQGTPAARVTG
jgi:RNA polymerase sigma-70 factor (ECF subfamily)